MNNSNSSTIENTSKVQAIFNSIKEFATFSHILRIIGAFIIIMSMSKFLLQEWSTIDDISRFYLMLGQTALLALAGVGLSFMLKENKGGRVFFSLSLISVSASVTILAALIFSIVQWDGSLVEYQSFSNWQLADIDSLSFAIIGMLIVSIPVTLFGFSVMIRQSSKMLTSLFLLTNSLLLIPVRDSFSIGFLSLIGVITVLLILHKKIQNNVNFRTFEGRLAITMVFLPIAIMIARCFWLYNPSEFMYLILASISFIGLRMCSKSITDERSTLRHTFDWLSVFSAFLISLPATSLLGDLLTNNLILSFSSSIFAALTLVVAYRASGNKRHVFVNLACMTLVVAHILQLVIFNSSLQAILCLLVGVVTMLVAKLILRKHLFSTGALTAFIGLLYQSVYLINGINFNSWLSMTVIGAAAIIIASLLERYGVILKLKWSKWSNLK